MRKDEICNAQKNRSHDKAKHKVRTSSMEDRQPDPYDRKSDRKKIEGKSPTLWLEKQMNAWNQEKQGNSDLQPVIVQRESVHAGLQKNRKRYLKGEEAAKRICRGSAGGSQETKSAEFGPPDPHEL
jgi:hypothetical protein